jgi:hypothetical protein
VTFDPGTATCSPASGSTFPLGTTTVQCGTFSFTVTVQDTTAPSLTLPGDFTISATGPSGAIATWSASASDLVDISDVVTCTPSSGSTLPLGTTIVPCSATDAHGNFAHGTFQVTVADLDGPVFTTKSVSPSSIWPPDGKLVAVTVTATAVDNVDPSPVIFLASISCNESIQPADAVITGPLTANLRADRDGKGSGRIYTLHLRTSDDSGNVTEATVTVTVPHDQQSPTVVIPAPPGRRRVGG